MSKSWLHIIDRNDTWQVYFSSIYPKPYRWFVDQHSLIDQADKVDNVEISKELHSSVSHRLTLHNWNMLTLLHDGSLKRTALRNLTDVPMLLAGAGSVNDAEMKSSSRMPATQRQQHCLQMLLVIVYEWTHTMQTIINNQSAQTMIPTDAPAVVLPLAEVTYWKKCFKMLQQIDEDGRSGTVLKLIKSTQDWTQSRHVTEKNNNNNNHKNNNKNK